ncbi:MAG: phenylalanine--tRNA ligase subunit beta [Pirellulaceae bacterium]|nr:phenylalanine--tRNA ligase subunit beta [Pirellulaceae bacterium]
MIVSWNWLREYVPLAISPDELTSRLMMAGLNHESTDAVGGDFALDLEITSNRPDCLGHLGIAREAAVLLGQPLTIPDPRPKAGATKVGDLTKITVECPDLCPRYSARVIRGVKIGSSPAWLADRLRTIGQPTINNVVDITNYVLMECGQPLHAFDFAKLAGREIIVRRAQAGEPFPAIDHKTYVLDGEMCVIADSQRPVALGGVMGGADSEVSPATKDLLIEAAQFAPLSIRSTARKLKLHSPSSYRFERGTDPAMVDWASRRCCELILNLAGGELADGVIDVGPTRPTRPPITLRLSQLQRIIGIEVPAETVRRILAALGCIEQAASATEVVTLAPSWRRDLDREIDLVEEVARIHGYDQIPEDAQVPMAPSRRPHNDRVLGKARQVLTAAGCDEAMTASVVSEAWSDAFSPWTDAPPLVANTPMLEGADRLRRSLVPSLLDVRRTNESLSNPVIELFEIAKVYLPRTGQLPREQWTVAAVSGLGFLHVKGIVEALLAALHVPQDLVLGDFRHELLAAGQACELTLGAERLGFVGDVSAAGQKAFGLRGPATILELDLSILAAAAVLVPQHANLSPYPTMARDINLIVAEAVRWGDLAGTVRSAAGSHLERLAYLDTYRDPQKDGPDTKRLLFSFTLRAPDRTLTSHEADGVRDAIVAACQARYAARLLV